MSTAFQQILGLEVAGPARSSPRDLGLSMAILSELLVASEACEAARLQRKVVSYSSDSAIFLLFDEGDASPFGCALDLSEMLRDLPLMSVRMVLHRGAVEFEPDRTRPSVVIGEGIDEARRLLEDAVPGDIFVSEYFAEGMTGRAPLPSVASQGAGRSGRIEPMCIAILTHTLENDYRVAEALRAAFIADGHEVWNDENETSGVAWAKQIEARIRDSDAIIAVVSHAIASNELLQYELEIAAEERRNRGRPHILPVWVDEPEAGNPPPVLLSQSLYQPVWAGEGHTEEVMKEVRTILAGGQAVREADRLDTTGRESATDANYYVRRAADDAFENAIRNRESIVLLKGPRQIGKTTLLGRGIGLVDNLGWRLAATDFQMLAARQLESERAFYRVVVTTLCRQLGFDFDFDAEWMDGLSPLLNMDRFIRDLLEVSDRPLVWFMDEADRLFSSPLATDFFGLVRSWHNARATDPSGPWDRLTIAIGYAAEAHLFIRDLNKSPFNVGRRIELPMLTRENLTDLNARFGGPLSAPSEIDALFELLNGQPYLTRRAFETVANGQMTFAELLARADREDGPFGDHLRRILLSVSQFPEVWGALVESIVSPYLPRESEGLHRLVAANVLVRTPGGKYELPLELYRRYLRRYATGEAS